MIGIARLIKIGTVRPAGENITRPFGRLRYYERSVISDLPLNRSISFRIAGVVCHTEIFRYKKSVKSDVLRHGERKIILLSLFLIAVPTDKLYSRRRFDCRFDRRPSAYHYLRLYSFNA